ncbi:MAG: radical SAM protein [Desulfobacteraceae bacterium IS3]|nr:MAG: radical SAM protein [Desulfobacteraceae bacterium IS3]
MASFKPAYIDTVSDGTIKEKIRDAFEILEDCVLCPRLCGVNRLSGETGVCKTGKNAAVSNFNPHFGEESPLVGTHGSGTIFFTRCNLLCIFCQNYDISHEAYGEEVSAEQIAGMMLMLQRSGCHNINFVTPSHVIPQILAAVEIAAEKGLCVPLIYNTGGYDRPEILKLLDGVFDIYMPDFKFWDPEIAKAACDAEDYPEVARDAIIEMHRQVGDLVIDESGLACRGLLIRHLVLPQGLAGTRDIMRFIASEISPDTYINIMPQYRPCGRASEIKALAGFPSRTEYENALKIAKEEGITRLDSEKRVFAIC